MSSEYGSGEWFRQSLQPAIRATIREEISRALDILAEEINQEAVYTMAAGGPPEPLTPAAVREAVRRAAQRVMADF